MTETLINPSKVAILLATYNGEKYLRTLLDSILDQTSADWTLYVRDDNSKDTTKSILKEYQEKTSKIVMIEDVRENLGCNGNFYHMLEVVDSDYYMFCDQDDEWLPEKVEVSLRIAEETSTDNPGKPVIVHSDFSVTNDKLDIIYPSYWAHIHMNPELYYDRHMVALANPVVGASMILNRQLRDISQPLKGSDMMYDSWISLVCVRNNGVIIADHGIHRKYRIHESNVAGRDFLKKRSFLDMGIIRKVLRTNIDKANRLQFAGCMKTWQYPYYKIKYTLMRKYGYR